MNISNALFEFTQGIVAAAAPGAALENVQMHADVYEEFKPGKTIRVDDLRTATPVLAAGGGIRKDNAVISVQFVAMPLTQALSDRLAARQTSEDMADEWLLKMFDSPNLADGNGVHRVCAVGQIVQFNDWIKPGTVKMPVCVLRINVNPRR